MARKRKEPLRAPEVLAADAAETDGAYLVAIPHDLFLRLAAIAARSGVTTEDFVIATLERTALPHGMKSATTDASHLSIYDD
jgi:hypothetical protein